MTHYSSALLRKIFFHEDHPGYFLPHVFLAKSQHLTGHYDNITVHLATDTGSTIVVRFTDPYIYTDFPGPGDFRGLKIEELYDDGAGTRDSVYTVASARLTDKDNDPIRYSGINSDYHFSFDSNKTMTQSDLFVALTQLTPIKPHPGLPRFLQPPQSN